MIESYYAAVQRFLRAKLRGSDWAEDLTQETYARALNQRLIIDAAGNRYNPVHGAPFDRSLIPSADKNCRSTRTSSRRARCLPIPSFDAMLAPIFKTIEPEEDELEAARKRVGGPLPETLPVMNWGAYTTHRDPVLSMFAEFAVTNNPKDPNDHVHGHLTLDPRTGKVLSHDRLRIGSGFFYPLHFRLHLEWKNLGTWIVGLAALVMLAALVSGVVMHRRIFRELFTFRPNKQTRRSTLDLHNLTGVVALPFHFVFAFSGLVVFASISHWRQVRGAQRLSRRGRMVLRVFGVFALALSLFICLRADHATMAPLVWVMALAAGALLVAFALAWRPRLLGPLIAWLRTT